MTCVDCEDEADRTIGGDPYCKSCRGCGCSDDNGPCDNHNSYLSGGDSADERNERLNRELRESGRGHLQRERP